jgi:hypothetical protein
VAAERSSAAEARVRGRVELPRAAQAVGRLFTLEAEVVLTRTPSEKAFTARFRKQPDWKLPFLVAPLLRSSLRRPFTGEGALLSLAARGAPGATVLVRHYRLAVKEALVPDRGP